VHIFEINSTLDERIERPYRETEKNENGKWFGSTCPVDGVPYVPLCRDFSPINAHQGEKGETRHEGNSQ